MKRFLFILFIALIFTPMVSQYFGYKNGNLGGYYVKIEKPELSLKAFNSLEFQNKLEKYGKQQIAFADFFIKFSNQIRYTFLKSSNVKGVVVGKDNYLYYDYYINSYLGRDSVPQDTVSLVVKELAQVRDSLKVKGVDLVIMIVPGKGSFYPEYFPKYYSRLKPEITNYEKYSKEFYKHNINYLDFYAWIRSLKGKTKYRLFSNTGVHWGQYACYLTIDSLTSYFDKKYAINLPRLKISNVKESTNMIRSDDDAEKLMNVIKNIPDYPMPNVELKVDSAGKDKLRVLSIGDSYFYGLNDLGLNRSVFYESEFWFYFEYVDKPNNPTGIKYIIEYDDIKEEIEKHDVLLIVMTDGTLTTSPISFARKLYYHYCQKPEYNEEFKDYVKKYTLAIKNNKNWLKNIELKAKKNGVSLEEAIDIDAKYMAIENLKKKYK